jgi:uncharacterized membrane protein
MELPKPSPRPPRHWIFDRHDERVIALAAGLVGLLAAVLAVVAAIQGDRRELLWNGLVAVLSFCSVGWSLRKARQRPRGD